MNKTMFHFTLIPLNTLGENSPVDWDFRIHQLHLFRGVDSPNERPDYDTKHPDGEGSIMFELWGMQSVNILSWLMGRAIIFPWRKREL